MTLKWNQTNFWNIDIDKCSAPLIGVKQTRRTRFRHSQLPAKLRERFFGEKATRWRTACEMRRYKRRKIRISKFLFYRCIRVCWTLGFRKSDARPEMLQNTSQSVRYASYCGSGLIFSGLTSFPMFLTRFRVFSHCFSSKNHQNPSKCSISLLWAL
mgnify:CR=1 FL=1